MKKKMLALLLTAGMVVSALSACGQAEKETSKPAESSKQETQKSEVKESSQPKESEEKQEIEKVIWCIPTAVQDDDEQVLEEMNKLLRERYSLELELVCAVQAEFSQRMQLMSTGGEDYDLAFVSNWCNKFNENLDREALLPLNDLLESEAAELLLSVYPEGLAEVARRNGEIYALPNYQLIYQQYGAYIQKDLAEKYGLDWTKKCDTLTDLEPFMQQILDNEKDIWPVAENVNVQMAWGRPYEEINAQVGIGKEDDTFQAKLSFEEEIPLMWQKMNEYYKKGFIREDVATVTDNSGDRNSNRYAVIVGTSKPGGEADYTAKGGKEYVQIPFGEPFLTYSAGISTMTGINVNSKNPEAAIKMLGVMWTDKEIFNMFVFGLEGEHYKKVGENRVELIPDSGYDRSAFAWALGNQFDAYLMPGQADDAWEVTEAYNRSAEQSHLAGFTFDSTPISTESAQCSAVQKEFGNGYIWTDDLEQWRADFVAKLKAAGVDKVAEEIQRQVDEWRKANGK